jgi:hypothetical protein
LRGKMKQLAQQQAKEKEKKWEYEEI